MAPAPFNRGCASPSLRGKCCAKMKRAKMKRRACSDDIIQRMSYLFPGKDTVKQRICVGDMTGLPSGAIPPALLGGRNGDWCLWCIRIPRLLYRCSAQRLRVGRQSLGDSDLYTTMGGGSYHRRRGTAIKQELVVSRQPILFVNLKSNTMKNTLQR